MAAARLAAASGIFAQVALAGRDGCTSVILGNAATVDGSAITSHTYDDTDIDWRMVYIPARDHPEGSVREIHDTVWHQYPRLIQPDRSPEYTGGVGITEPKKLGSIPQVSHTYALWENAFGIMNEHGLGIGESTCNAWLVGNSTATGGDDLLSIGNLIAIALERCVDARCAVLTMGELAARYGFVPEGPSVDAGGEALQIVDKLGEAWVFHVAGGVKAQPGDDSWAGQRGALWAAQRVPPGHVAVVANQFIIREVDPSSDDFLLHPGLFELAKEAKLWNGEGAFDFQKIMCPDPRFWSASPKVAPIPRYTTLRMWAVFRHAAPSANIAMTDNMHEFPFSVPVDRKVSHLDVMDWLGDHYEGTEYDMTLGVQAGPFGSPNRAEGGMGGMLVKGQMARAISIQRTAYTTVIQSAIPEPVIWYTPDAPASAVFVPFFSSALAEGPSSFDVETYGRGSQKEFSFTSGSLPPAWWAFDFVANWMEINYANMSAHYVYPRKKELQAEVQSAVDAALKEAAASPGSASAILATTQKQLQRKVVEEWWSFAAMLVVRYNDGFFNWAPSAPTKALSLGYPAYWLEMIGYDQQFFLPHWAAPTAQVPQLLPEAAKAQVEPATATVLASKETTSSAAGNVGLLQGASQAISVTFLCALVAAGAYSKGRADERKASSSNYVKLLG